MRRNRIRVERIEDEQIEFLVRRIHDRQTPVAEHHVTTPFRNAAEMRRTASNNFHLRIDLEECDVSVRLRVRRNGARPETNNANVLRRTIVHDRHHIA